MKIKSLFVLLAGLSISCSFIQSTEVDDTPQLNNSRKSDAVTLIAAFLAGLGKVGINMPLQALENAYEQLAEVLGVSKDGDFGDYEKFTEWAEKFTEWALADKRERKGFSQYSPKSTLAFMVANLLSNLLMWAYLVDRLEKIMPGHALLPLAVAFFLGVVLVKGCYYLDLMCNPRPYAINGSLIKMAIAGFLKGLIEPLKIGYLSDHIDSFLGTSKEDWLGQEQLASQSLSVTTAFGAGKVLAVVGWARVISRALQPMVAARIP